MAKAKMKQVVIPKVSSEAEEAAWWDRHRSEVEIEIRRRMKQKRPLTLGNLQRAKPSQPICILSLSCSRFGKRAGFAIPPKSCQAPAGAIFGLCY
jgi:hypothetical protein